MVWVREVEVAFCLMFGKGGARFKQTPLTWCLDTTNIMTYCIIPLLQQVQCTVTFKYCSLDANTRVSH